MKDVQLTEAVATFGPKWKKAAELVGNDVNKAE